jgi:phospholipid transport system substrate-binding protein
MIIRCSPWLRAAAALSLSIALFARPAASMAMQDPRAFIGTLGTQAIDVLAPSVQAAERIALFRVLIAQDFDADGIGRFALGRYWPRATPQQRQVFLALFQEYTARVYSYWLGAYGGAEFRVTGSRRNGDRTIVTSEIPRPDGRTMRLDWLLDRNGAEYKISDVYIDGLSTKVTERDQFASWIEKNGGGVDALIAVLRQQIALLQ